MLFLSGPGVGRSTFPFAGAGLGGTADVQRLQQALSAYGQAKGLTGMNPGSVAGDLTDQTVVATLFAMWKLGEKVPGLRSVQGKLLQIPGVKTVFGVLFESGLAMVAWATVPAGTKGTLRTFVNDQAGIIATVLQGALASETGGVWPTNTGGNPALQFTQVNPALLTRLKDPAATGQAKIAAFDAKKGVYRIAVPRGVGATEATHTEVGTSATPPADARVVSIEEFKKLVGEKNVMKGILIGAGIAVGVVGLGWFLLK